MKMIYEAPVIEIIKVEVEEGFNASLGYTDDYADEYRKQVRCVELFLFISEDSFHIVHRASFAHDSEFVTELESKVARWQQIDACTVYAGDVDAI